jgi:hypothetical protein
MLENENIETTPLNINVIHTVLEVAEYQGNMVIGNGGGI